MYFFVLGFFVPEGGGAYIAPWYKCLPLGKTVIINVLILGSRSPENIHSIQVYT